MNSNQDNRTDLEADLAEATDYDSPWKESLEFFFDGFLAYYFPRAYAAIDWSRGYEFLDQEFQQIVRDAEHGRRIVDKLVKVWLLDGSEQWLLIHVEVQGQYEKDFETRIFVYHYRIFDRYNQRVGHLILLTDESETWRPERFGYDLWYSSIDFRFQPAKLLDFIARPVSEELARNPFHVLTQVHYRTQTTRNAPDHRRFWKFRFIKGLFESGMDSVTARKLLHLIDWMMNLPRPDEQLFTQELKDFLEGSKVPHVTSLERFFMERGLKIGIEEGIEKGTEKGIVKGRTDGRIEMARELLAEEVQSRFGNVETDLRAAIEAINDVQVLKSALRKMRDVRSSDEIRDLLKSASA